jgi:hypothetical protein
MGKYESVATVHGPHGDSEIKHEEANEFDCATLHLFYNGDYAVVSPSGSRTFHKDFESALDRAERSSGRK